MTEIVRTIEEAAPAFSYRTALVVIVAYAFALAGNVVGVIV